MKEKKTNKKLVAIIVSVVLAIIIIPTAIYCITNATTPIQMVGDIFQSNEKQIVGKWQGEEKATAYEFYDDATYDSYISTFSYTGSYNVEGNVLTLNNADISGTVSYKISIHGKTMKMKIYKENGVEVSDGDELVYKKVDVIKTTSLQDLLDELTTEAEDSNE